METYPITIVTATRLGKTRTWVLTGHVDEATANDWCRNEALGTALDIDVDIRCTQTYTISVPS